MDFGKLTKDGLIDAGAHTSAIPEPDLQKIKLLSPTINSPKKQKSAASTFQVMTTNGSMEVSGDLPSALAHLADLPFGELLLNSIDRDGTGMGLDFGLLDEIPSKVARPVILSGGVGNAAHIAEALRDPRVSAVATANLLNFVDRYYV